MRLRSQVVLGTVINIGIVMILLLGFHVGGQSVLAVGNYSQLFGSLIGGTLTFLSIYVFFSRGKNREPWFRFEQLGWTLIGSGCFAWAFGECFWRYYRALGQNPFPSQADIGYSCFPPLVFVGLFLLTMSGNKGRRVFYLLDSLISMGALLSIAWFLLLGSLAQTPAESIFAKVLGLYYPTADTMLLSCTIFLLLRERDATYQADARRISLFLITFGLIVFSVSDFIFNLQQNLGTYVEGNWVDLGWPLGMMTLGLAAYFRSSLPATSHEVLEQRLKQNAKRIPFEPAQALPYLLLLGLFCMLAFNVLSVDPAQMSIRPVLVVATLLVVGLVLVRQVLTILHNAQLLREQKTTLQELARLNQSIAERNQSITERNALLEAGITHLKETQTRLANGEVRARAAITSGELWPLAVGLNLMADRMMRVERSQMQAQKLTRAIEDLSLAFVRARIGGPFILPPSAVDFPEIHSLIEALGLKVVSTSNPVQSHPYVSPLQSVSDTSPPFPDGSGDSLQPQTSIPSGTFLKRTLRRHPLKRYPGTTSS